MSKIKKISLKNSTPTQDNSILKDAVITSNVIKNLSFINFHFCSMSEMLLRNIKTIVLQNFTKL